MTAPDTARNAERQASLVLILSLLDGRNRVSRWVALRERQPRKDPTLLPTVHRASQRA